MNRQFNREANSAPHSTPSISVVRRQAERGSSELAAHYQELCRGTGKALKAPECLSTPLPTQSIAFSCGLPQPKLLEPEVFFANS